MSGEKGATRSKPARKKKKQPSPSSAPRGGVARGVVTVRKAEEERKGFEDILGLVSMLCGQVASVVPGQPLLAIVLYCTMTDLN